MVKKQNTGDQVPRHSTRMKNTTTGASKSDDKELSGSVTPAWEGGPIPSRPDEPPQNTGPAAPGSVEDELEEDEFMPSVQQVAATLVGMRSRRHEDNRGTEEVSLMTHLGLFASTSDSSRHQVSHHK